MTENPLTSIHATILHDGRDWSQDKRSAWIYGVVIGWPREVMKELQTRFDWSEDEVARLDRLRQRFEEAKRELDGAPPVLL